MRDGIKTFLTSEEGATVIEYSFILALVALATVGAFTKFSTSVDNMWGYVESSFTGSVNQ